MNVQVLHVHVAMLIGGKSGAELHRPVFTIVFLLGFPYSVVVIPLGSRESKALMRVNSKGRGSSVQTNMSMLLQYMREFIRNVNMVL
jgi:hypothetical protein